MEFFWCMLINSLPAVIVGLLPAAIAYRKGYNFYMWWLFGALLWIVATPWAIIMRPDRRALALRDGLVKCPHCLEWIDSTAIRCKFCGQKRTEEV